MKHLAKLVIVLVLMLVVMACGAVGGRTLEIEKTEVAAPAPRETEIAGEAPSQEESPPQEEASPGGEVVPAYSGVVPSLYEEDFSFTPANRFEISEVELMLDALELLVEANWDGDKDKPLPLSIEDFDQAKLEAYIADEISDDEAFTIPPELESLYISPEAADELGDLIIQARNEYVAYLAEKGTLPEYIAEIDEHVMPLVRERMIYHPENDPNSPSTAVDGLIIGEEKDFSRLQLDVYAVDIYNKASVLQSAGLLGPEPTGAEAWLAYHRQLRDMGTRFLVYHEMTHVVQRAHVNLHVSDEDNRVSKTAWIYATQTLIDVDTQYHWVLEGFYVDAINRHVSDESQADGISFEVFVTMYDLSPSQRDAFWDHAFGRLEGARESLDQIRTLLETRYPDVYPDEFGSMLRPVLKEYPDQQSRYILTSFSSRFSLIPSYVGYMNPMRPEDTGKFWSALREF